MVKGTSRTRASVCASSVLPELGRSRGYSTSPTRHLGDLSDVLAACSDCGPRPKAPSWREQAMAGKTATTAYRRAGFRRYRWPGSARGGVSITSAAERVRVFAPVRGHANRLTLAVRGRGTTRRQGGDG